jgi:predicted Fe-Mo cluster-binding NifX family protein
MKLLFTAKGEDWDSQLDPRFGRATGYILVDTSHNEKSWISNEENTRLAHGAGIQAAQKASGMGAEVIITGKVGPKAKSTLENAGIRIFTVETPCTVEEAYNQYMDKKT